MSILYSSISTHPRHQSDENSPNQGHVFNPRTSAEYTHGYAAFFAACPLSGNPYLSANPTTKSRHRAKHWLLGWCDAESDAADCPLVDIGCASIAIEGGFDDEQ